MNEDKDCAKCVCVDNSERQDHSSDHAYQMTGKKTGHQKRKENQERGSRGRQLALFKKMIYVLSIVK